MAYLLESLVDLDRYPITQPDSQRLLDGVAAARRELSEEGVAILPGFVPSQMLREMAREIERIGWCAYYENVSVGTPYLELPDEAYPDGHPRRTNIHSATSVIAYDQIPSESPVRALYESEVLMDFVAEILERKPLYRFGDPLGAVNLTIMREGDVQGWHYDSTDFVVSLAIQASEAGGQFECASRIRTAVAENYPDVAGVMRGEREDLLEVVPMTPGTLMIFEGRNSLHRVSPVKGEVPRYVGLFAYDTRPGTDSSELLKMGRYGRVEPLSA